MGDDSIIPFSKSDQGKHDSDVSIFVFNKFRIFGLTWIGEWLKIDKIDVGCHVTQCCEIRTKRTPFRGRILGWNITGMSPERPSTLKIHPQCYTSPKIMKFLLLLGQDVICTNLNQGNRI